MKGLDHKSDIWNVRNFTWGYLTDIIDCWSQAKIMNSRQNVKTSPSCLETSSPVSKRFCQSDCTRNRLVSALLAKFRQGSLSSQEEIWIDGYYWDRKLLTYRFYFIDELRKLIYYQAFYTSKDNFCTLSWKTKIVGNLWQQARDSITSQMWERLVH